MTAPTQVTVPDIGDFSDVPIIEIHVHSGDRVNAEDPLVTLESDKATMDVPSPVSGVVHDVPVKVGDRVSEGTLILTMSAGEGTATAPPTLVEQQEPEPQAPPAAAGTSAAPATTERSLAPGRAPAHGGPPGSRQDELTERQRERQGDGAAVHAGPSVRRTARELGVDLTGVTGTGPKGRITKDDLLAFLRGPAPGPSAPAAAPTTGIPEIPAVDFSTFGPVEIRPLSRIKKISGPFLHRSWLNVPHVTHHDEADITELDAYRKELDTAARAEGYRVTLIAFLLKAAVSALRQFPELNSSISPEKDTLIVKGYHHIGVAVDTPDGLVVPVIRDVGSKGVTELSKELGALSQKAREGKLQPADMQGGTFTISSLGGIGGTGFTPIVNAPEVAILGVVRARTAPVWDGESFRPRLMLPLSLSYDHRVVDGALAARFTRHLCTVLEDVRRLIL